MSEPNDAAGQGPRDPLGTPQPNRRMELALLAVLYISTLVRSFGHVFHPEHLVYSLKAVADIVLLGLCIAGVFALAGGRSVATPRVWLLIRRLTLALGFLAVGMHGYPELFGLPESYRIKHIWLFLIFLPYFVFALPLARYGAGDEPPNASGSAGSGGQGPQQS